MKLLKKDIVYDEYINGTNVTYQALLNWSRKDISKTASVMPKDDSRQAIPERRKLRVLANLYGIPLKDGLQTAIIRNLVLKKIPKREWDKFLISQAIKANSYIKRHKIILQGKIKRLKSEKKKCEEIKSIIKDAPVYIGLKNWGYDYYKR